MEAVALIEIDGLQYLLKMMDLPWQTVSHNQRVISNYFHLFA